MYDRMITVSVTLGRTSSLFDVIVNSASFSFPSMEILTVASWNVTLDVVLFLCFTSWALLLIPWLSLTFSLVFAIARFQALLAKVLSRERRRDLGVAVVDDAGAEESEELLG